jgi:hypothetical protein
MQMQIQVQCNKRFILVIFVSCALLLAQFMGSLPYVNPYVHPDLNLDIKPDINTVINTDKSTEINYDTNYHINHRSGFAKPDSNDIWQIKIHNWLNTFESSGVYNVLKSAQEQYKQKQRTKNWKNSCEPFIAMPDSLTEHFSAYAYSINISMTANNEALLMFLHNQDGMK